MFSKKWHVLIVVLVIGNALLAACAPPTAPEAEVREVEVTREVQVEGETQYETVIVTATPGAVAAAVDEPADVQKVLRINLGTYPDTIDPQKSSFVNEIAHLRLIYEGLTKFDGDLETVPAAAESWEYNEDATVLTFVLREGLTYSDGIIAALKQNTWIDYLSALIANIGVSVPNFVIGIYLIIIFGVLLHWVNVVPRSWDNLKVWIIPAMVLGSGTMAFTARLTRSAMIEVMRQDYIRTARAKGLRETAVISRHMLKNALIPVVTVLGPALAGLVTGSFIIETMFGFPGVGREYVQAISNRDYSMILGSTLLFGVLIALSNLSVDILYGVLDPRIRIE